MKIALCLLSAICFTLNKKQYKNWNNPYVVFNALWFCVSLLILIGDERVYVPSATAFGCLLIGILGFNVSSLTPKLSVNPKLAIRKNISYDLNIKRIELLSTILLVWSIILGMDSLKAFMSGVPMTEIRNEYFTYGASNNVLVYYLKSYIFEPLRYVLIVATVIMIFNPRYRSVKLLSKTLTIILLQAISSGGRYILMNTFFMTICVFLFSKKMYGLTFKQKITVAFIAISLGYATVFLTNQRATYAMADLSTAKRVYSTIYDYFAGSTTYLGKVIETTPGVKGATCGINFAAGLISPLFAVLAFLGILPYPNVLNYIGIEACKVLQIGDYTYFNAMPTIFGYFFIDGGFAGVFIEAWFFGYFCKRLYIHAKQGNMLFVALYTLSFLQICNSSTRWFFYTTDYCFAFIFMRLFFCHSKKEGMVEC